MNGSALFFMSNTTFSRFDAYIKLCNTIINKIYHFDILLKKGFTMKKNTLLTILAMGVLSLSVGVANADTSVNKSSTTHTHGDRSHSHAGPISHSHNSGPASSAAVAANVQQPAQKAQVVYVEQPVVYVQRPAYYPSYVFGFGFSNRHYRGYNRGYRSNRGYSGFKRGYNSNKRFNSRSRSNRGSRGNRR